MVLDRGGLRTFVIAGFCVALLVWNWRYLSEPEHSAMTMLVLAAVFTGAVFYELTVRDASMGWVLGGISGVMALAALTWIGLRIFAVPLANDHAPLLPARDSNAAGGCPIPHGTLQAILAETHVIGSRPGSVTPFRVGLCLGPTVTRTASGLLVNTFGYDGDGTVVYRIRNNQFELLQGEYLHIHRTDRSTLAVYDKTENEIFYLRYLSPDAVRIRGRFICGQQNSVTIEEDELSDASGRVSLPSCVTLKAGAPLNIAAQTH